MKKTIILFLIVTVISSVQAQKNKFNLIIGTFTNSCESKGIYVYDFDTDTGNFKFKNATKNVINPSFLTVSKSNKTIYSINRNGPDSSASSFTFDSSNGGLTFINKQDSKGSDPCYIINDDKNVIVANYGAGNIAVFGKNSDGSLAPSKQVIQHFGKGPNTERQKSPHVHMVYFSPDKKFVLANDLGNDKLYIYSYNANASAEVLKIKDSITLESGSGPRHLTFSNDGKMMYLLQELSGGIVAFKYANGSLKKLQQTTVLDKDFKGPFTAADIHVSPDGKFLYASNRGEANTISIFKILKSGLLESIGQTSCLGKGPRNFVIDPTGNFLLVGNQYTNEVVIFKRNLNSGLLADTGKRIALCAPVCLVFTKI